jgi:hypothetical protein
MKKVHHFQQIEGAKHRLRAVASPPDWLDRQPAVVGDDGLTVRSGRS